MICSLVLQLALGPARYFVEMKSPVGARRIIISAIVAGPLSVELLASVVGPASGATTPLPCHASMSNARPTAYSTTDVEIVTTPLAAITTSAAYKTKSTVHTAVASKLGQVAIPYKLSSAGTCATSFTPVK
jgi:hypothetical protein